MSLKYTLQPFPSHTVDLDAELTPANLAIVQNGWLYSYESRNVTMVVSGQPMGFVALAPNPGAIPVLQGGNTLGAALTIGTNDNNDVVIERNGVPVATFTAAEFDLDLPLLLGNTRLVGGLAQTITLPDNLPPADGSFLQATTAGQASWRKRLYQAFTAATTTAGGAGDRDLLTLTIPAGHSFDGMAIEFEFRGLQSQGNTVLTAKNLNAYLKVNATKFVDIPIAVGTGAQTNRAIRFAGALQVLTAGATAQLVAGAEFSVAGVANEPIVSTGLGTLNTGNAYTLTIGFAYNNANAANTVSTRVGYFSQKD